MRWPARPRSTCPTTWCTRRRTRCGTSRRAASRRRGSTPSSTSRSPGKTEEDLVTESEPEAERALRREAALAAVIEAEGIEVSDDEMMNALREAAAQPGTPGATDKALRRSLKKARAQGTDEALREDIAMRKAVDLLVEHAKPIPAARAEARDELWTPDKDRADEGWPEEALDAAAGSD